MAGPGVPLDTFAADARRLDESAFAERHGRAFLVFASKRLVHAYGPEATRSLSTPAGIPGSTSGTGEALVQPAPAPAPATPAAASGDDAELSVLPLVRDLSSAYPFISLGRTRENDVVLRDASVSKFQAYFKERAPGSWLVRDCNSRNGTHVNGVRVASTKDGDDEEPTPLTSGARIKLGGVEATFFVVAAFMRLVLENAPLGPPPAAGTPA